MNKFSLLNFRYWSFVVNSGIFTRKKQVQYFVIAYFKNFICRFKELAADNSLNALTYLQTSLSEIIDHSDLEQTREVSNQIYVILI